MSTRFHHVQDILDTYKSAVYEKDVEKYLSAYSPDIHLYDCWDDWECVGIAQWADFVKKWFYCLEEDGLFSKIEFDDVVVEEDENLAFVRCNITFADYNKSNEKLRQITNRFTFGLRKVNDSWTIVHQHSSNPISGETGKGIFSRQ